MLSPVMAIQGTQKISTYGSTLAAVDFEECFANREEEKIDGVVVNFIDVENLKKNKTASGRPQDIADVDNLK